MEEFDAHSFVQTYIQVVMFMCMYVAVGMNLDFPDGFQ